MNTKIVLLISGAVIALALVIGWIVLVATGHTVDAAYVGITGTVIGGVLGTNVHVP